MPVPFLLGALAVGAGAFGIGGHLSAKETNEEAARVSGNAQSLYNNAKNALTSAKKEAEGSLEKLGYDKKNVLDTSMSQFLVAYERVKYVKVKDSIGLNELSNFTISSQDALELRQMTDIYSSSFSSGAAGAATGAAIALAASGSLPLVTGGLSLAGSFLAVGEVGAAASIAGSSLLAGAAMTPLAAFAAPVVLFTGVSANIKADENLEKAKASYAEAEAAAEKMKVSETLCNGIRDRANMYDDLLADLNQMFAKCTVLLDRMTEQKVRVFKNKEIKSEDLAVEEANLIAVTRALAGAVKAVIDTPILTKEGNLTSESIEIYDNTYEQLPDFKKVVAEVESVDYDAIAKSVKTTSANGLWESARNVLAIIIGWVGAFFVQAFIAETAIVWWLGFTVITLLIMNDSTQSKFFNKVKTALNVGLALEFAILLYQQVDILVYKRFFYIVDIVVAFVSFIAVSYFYGLKDRRNFKNMMLRLTGLLTFFCIGLLLYAILHRLIGLPIIICKVLCMILYVPFAIATVFLAEK